VHYPSIEGGPQIETSPVRGEAIDKRRLGMPAADEDDAEGDDDGKRAAAAAAAPGILAVLLVRVRVERGTATGSVCVRVE